MEPKQVFKQMIEFNKTAFDSGFTAIVMLQDQVERMAKMLMEQSPWVPDEGKKALNGWINPYKIARDDLKRTMDQNVEKMAEYYSAIQ